ncbi:BTB/POZ domain-containing protein 9-like isoform X3 [Gordionus sp. m RMFG-2023]|uniref:BTB/POZ domain-containing protein 9-like isoform X3 n=1 Tax=Gordionus sp. m RMFG-2023 TaxID=3053472 RepID=UPI0031FCDA82
MNLTSQKVNLLYSIIIFFKGSTGNYRLQNNGKKTKQVFFIGYKIMERKQNLNEEYSDVVFIVDGKRFHAHKFILASKSEYFRALLYGGMKKSLPDCNELELKDAPNQAFKTLLKYIYTGKMNLTSQKVIYGKLRARKLQHHPQKRNHIEQRKENFFTIAKPSSSPTTVIYGKLRARKLQHHLQKRNHIEQRKENLYYSSIIE